MPRIKIEVTKTQLEAIKEAADNHSAMMGTVSDSWNKSCERIVKNIDEMLSQNSLEKRNFK